MTVVVCCDILWVCLEGQGFLLILPEVRKGVENVIQIRLKKGEPVERALKRLKKIMDKEGLLKQLRNNRYYEKPCEKARRKSARARIRNNSRRGMRDFL